MEKFQGQSSHQSGGNITSRKFLLELCKNLTEKRLSLSTNSVDISMPDKSISDLQGLYHGGEAGKLIIVKETYSECLKKRDLRKLCDFGSSFNIIFYVNCFSF